MLAAPFRRWCSLLLALPMLAAAPARACGFEDPRTVAIGVLNFAYPDALHVGTAVWQAQQEGLLPRPLPLTDAPQARQAALWEVLRLLDRWKQQWPLAERDAPVALVFVDSALWSRLVWHEGKRVLLPHVSGAQSGDLVIVGDPLVLSAWLERRLDGATLLARGLVRLYGDAEATAAVRAAFERGPLGSQERD